MDALSVVVFQLIVSSICFAVDGTKRLFIFTNVCLCRNKRSYSWRVDSFLHLHGELMKRKVKLLRRRSELSPASLSSKEKKGKLPPSSKECFPRLSSFPKQQQPSTTKFYFAQIFLLVDNDDGVFRRHPPFRLLPLGHRVHPLHPHLLHLFQYLLLFISSCLPETSIFCSIALIFNPYSP